MSEPTEHIEHVVEKLNAASGSPTEVFIDSPEPTEQQAGGFLTPLVRDEIRKRIDTARRSEKQYRKDPAFREEADAYKQYAEDYEAILTRDAEVVCISRETMAVLRVWLDRFTDREAFPSGDPFYEATLALREALEQTEASSE